jgi:GNAT superfamily N-acetyltransferase
MPFPFLPVIAGIAGLGSAIAGGNANARATQTATDASLRATMIRAARHDDTPAMLELLREFHGASGMAAVADYCAESMAATLARMIDNNDAILLVAEHGGDVVGVAGAAVFPAYWNQAQTIGQETFWWADPARRGRVGPALLQGLEDEARNRGAVRFLMVCLEALRPAAVGELYRRRGYEALEHSFVRSI